VAFLAWASAARASVEKEGTVGTKLLCRHQPRMEEEELEKRRDAALVAVSLSAATLITCFSIAFALL